MQRRDHGGAAARILGIRVGATENQIDHGLGVVLDQRAFEIDGGVGLGQASETQSAYGARGLQPMAAGMQSGHETTPLNKASKLALVSAAMSSTGMPRTAAICLAT